MTPLLNTREFVAALRHENEIIEIHDPVDPHLELAEIQRHAVAARSKALLFTNVKGCRFPVATNLYGSSKRIEIAFSKKPEIFIREAVATAEKIFPPTFEKIWNAKHLAFPLLKMGLKNVAEAPLLQNRLDLNGLKNLPQIKCWPEDGGAFITLPLVYTQSPVNKKSNLGMYRIQLFNERECGMHIQIHRGGGFHYHEAESRGESLPVHIYVGGPPALTIAAILPLPEDVPEVLFASLLMGTRLRTTNRADLSPLPFLADADFCIAGEIPPHARKPEGPFGDHYGYYSLQHDYPYVNVKHVFHRTDAIYPATVVGRPPQEDHFIACYLQDLLKPLIHMVMPQVRDVWAFEESGVHSLAGAVVKDRYPREALTTSLRILGEGQLSLSKVLLVTDQIIDVKNFPLLIQTVLERIDFTSDIFILSRISQDTLDYTGPRVNEGSKAVFLGLGDKKRELPKVFSETPVHSELTKIKVFCPGVLAVSGPAYRSGDQMSVQLAQDPAFKNWPCVFLVDDAVAATQSPEDFIWHVFTRFEPAADITAHEINARRFHFEFTPPLVFDCRMKPWYPKVLTSDPDVLQHLTPLLDKYGFLR